MAYPVGLWYAIINYMAIGRNTAAARTACAGTEEIMCTQLQPEKARTPSDKPECKTTDELTHEIYAATDIEDYLSDNKSSFLSEALPEHLKKLLSQKNLTRAEVARRAQLEKAYVYQIFSGERMPSRDKLITLAFGLGLSADETQTMLKISGYKELYARSRRDSVMLFALNQNNTLFEVNEMLYKHGLALL